MNNHDKDALEKLQLSGKILRETREEMISFVREDMPIIEICEKAEALIREKGGKPAFPCNVSVNEIAAHYTSPRNDTTKIPRNSIVKVDIGVHVDGYVTDTAFTVSFNPEYKILVETAEQALKVAIDNIRPEMPTSKLGEIIEKTIKSRGLKPISNLTGHSVGRYLVHAGTSVPNVSQLSFSKIKLGGVYAIEPFVTLSDAVGRVEDGDEATIFRFLKSKSVKNPYAKQLMKYIEENFRTLPFAERWLKDVVPNEHHRDAFRELLASKAIMSYPIFVEISRKPVAQAEHTVLIVQSGCVVLT
ncbi:MAG: type II methionyl aminopeptidase [Candidatus Bathyarchaeota archaeon]|jgi:methionyl aminopeptidase|nr:type II methionyl aminopeptidase [Candidatus Bathyarchaeota archaeon A05DMB-5]MDH7557781.1 type II methionyl aminopeptidase [Candidatus Bathyarchaeota archaeon]